ncbi:DciA family protein [Streptomyces sp. NPDC001312]|uniref:DciA family protein n=1 Tax=Streptomyces sp. NPDC001312 TaxID=3364561 RepID=UPI0036811BFB
MRSSAPTRSVLPPPRPSTAPHSPARYGWPKCAGAAPRPLPRVRRPTAQDHHGQTRSALHAECGQLDLRPDSPAYATQLRLLSAQIITAANDAVGTQAVRAVRVLAVGARARHFVRRPLPPRPRQGPRCR